MSESQNDIQPHGDEVEPCVEQAQLSTDQQERRRHERYAIRGTTLLVCELYPPDRRETQFMVRCVDISTEGLGIMHDSPIDPGTPCKISLLFESKGLCSTALETSRMPTTCS